MIKITVTPTLWHSSPQCDNCGVNVANEVIKLQNEAGWTVASANVCDECRPGIMVSIKVAVENVLNSLG